MPADAPIRISLIIPTRERSETLRHAIKTALRQRSRSYEIVVSDNASQDDTETVVASFRDPRIRYLRTSRRLSMCDNWEFALEQTRGEYVVVIGDDDAVIPGGVDRLEAHILETPKPAYMWTTPIYNWPIDGRPAFIARLPGIGSLHEIDLRKIVRFVVSHGGWRYWTLPGVYHAAVSRAILDAVRDKTGRVFHTTQPDLFTSMAVPAFAPSALHLDHPVTSHGRSAKSNGGSGFARQGADHLARYIREFGDYRLHPSLFPDIPLYANLIADAFLVSMDRFPELYSPLTFNFEAMWAFFWRLRLLRARDILSRRKPIARVHRFRTSLFLFYCGVHAATMLRVQLRDAWVHRGPFAKGVPETIDEFVSRLADWQQIPLSAGM